MNKVAADKEVVKATRRVEELVFALDALADPTAASAARELVALVLQLHGKALATVMNTLAADPAGARLGAALADDEDVAGVLLLHDLHPDDIGTRVHAALDRLRPHLAVRGAAIQSVDVAGAKVSVRLGLSDAGRLKSGDETAIRRDVRQAVVDVAPDASEVEVEGLPAGVQYVPLASITIRQRPEGAVVAPG